MIYYYLLIRLPPEDNVLLLYASKEMIVLNKYVFKGYSVTVFQFHFHYWKQISFY